VEIACPACGKNNDLAGASACARCGCDLERLARTIAAAAAHLRAAIGALRRGEWADARRQAEKFWSLRHNSRSARLAALAALRLGDGAGFLRWRDRGNGLGHED
jgi:hypothetical protein